MKRKSSPPLTLPSELLMELQPKSKKGRYHARKVQLAGQTFDSKMEADHYLVLLSRLQSGEIAGLTLQPQWEIIPKWKNPYTGKTVRAKRYTADFQYLENGRVIVEEVKSKATKTARDFSLRWHLIQVQHPEIEFRLVME